MHLLLDGVHFGSLANYGYETPWAIARITPDDAEAYARLCRASEFWARDDVPDDDAEYERLLEELGITEADIRTLNLGRWTIDNPGSTLQGAIVLTECAADGWITWRWSG